MSGFLGLQQNKQKLDMALCSTSTSHQLCKNLIQKITWWSLVCNRQAGKRRRSRRSYKFSLSGWWWSWLNIPILGSKNSPFPGSILVLKIWFCNKTRQYEATRCVWVSNLRGPMKWFWVISTSFLQHPWMIFVADRTRQGKKQMHAHPSKKSPLLVWLEKH
jgi:hypothetical protein